jgi:hypothetical protein
MMDYAGWTKRASSFLRSLTDLAGDFAAYDAIEGLGNDDYTQEWLRSVSCSLPPELKAFIATASQRCVIHYQWKLPPEFHWVFAELYPGRYELVGGGDFCEAARFQVCDDRPWFQHHFLPQLMKTAAEIIPPLPPDSTPSLASAMEFMTNTLMSNVVDSEHAHGRITLMNLEGGAKISLAPSVEESSRTVVYVDPSDPAKKHVLSSSFDDFLMSWEQVGYIAPTLENLQPWLDPASGRLDPSHSGKPLLRDLLTSAAKTAKRERARIAENRYSSWIRRAESFVRRLNHLPGQWGVSVAVEPPITDAEADELAKTLPLGLPLPLRELYTKGAAKCLCRYNWTPDDPRLIKVHSVIPHQRSFYGGPEFIPCTELFDAHGMHSWWDGQDDQLTESQMQAVEVWRHSVPFIHVGNGDHVALHVTGAADEMPVVYLCHDDPETPVTWLSPSFDQFLADWEALGYLGPEIWLLDAFLGNGGGPLDVHQNNARRWREMLLLPAEQ